MQLTKDEIAFIINSPKKNPAHWHDMLKITIPNPESDKHITLRTMVKDHTLGRLEWVLPLQDLTIE